MADKAFFAPVSARSLTMRGSSGQTYKFNASGNMVAVKPGDAAGFRKNPALMEVDEGGNDLRPNAGSTRPEPRSYKKIEVGQQKVTTRRVR